MLALLEIYWFVLAALALGFTPGPNMAYCLSRALCQGRMAGLISLCGVLAAHGVYALATALGLTALVLTAPAALNAIRFAGAAYLLWLAWKLLRPIAAVKLSLQGAKPWTVSALFRMGFVINLLNPKTLLFYTALFPQFLKPEQGALVVQSLQLGAVQIAASGAVMGLLVCCVARLKEALVRSGPRSDWQNAPRYFLGSVFVVLALKLAAAP